MRSMKMTLALAVTALGLGCGSEGTTASFKLQDAPPQGVTKVEITVLSAEAHVVPEKEAKDTDPADTTVDDSPSWVTLEINKKIDLVAHQGEGAAVTLGELGLPEGKITMLRLKLDTTKGANNTLTNDKGEVCELDVEKVEKKGIKINKVFKAFESKGGTKSDVFFDFDLEESLKPKNDAKCGFEFKPVLKLHKVKKDGAEVTL
jgi:hypothetical protein